MSYWKVSGELSERLPGSNPVLRLSGPDAPGFSFSLLLSPLSFCICCLASPESKSHWRSSAYSRLATTLVHLERTRANIRYRSVSVISSLACDSKNIKYFSTLKKYKQKKKNHNFYCSPKIFLFLPNSQVTFTLSTSLDWFTLWFLKLPF